MFSKNSVKWLYRTEQPFAWESGLPIGTDQYFKDRSGAVRLVLEAGGRITVLPGYAWNGCSPKLRFFDLVVGTPDGVVYRRTRRPKTYYASMVHDALYQFMGASSPVSRGEADRCFLRLMAESEFLWRRVYWLAVRIAGRLVWHGKRVVRQWRGTREVVAELVGAAGASDAPPGLRPNSNEGDGARTAGGAPGG